MTWVRLDDKFHRNPKALKMTDAAHRIYVDSLSYCADTTDLLGFLSFEETEAFVRSRSKPMKVVEELVNLGAWEQVHDGYLIHDWSEYVPPRVKQRVIDFQSAKKADYMAIRAGLTADSPRDIPVARSPEPVPVPEPVVINYPSVGSPHAHPTLNMNRLGDLLPQVLRGGQ